EVKTIRFYIEDMTPEGLEYSLDKIRRHALDAYTVPATGKKGRTGWEVTVISKKSAVEEVINTVMEETSTLGVRIGDVRRVVSERKIKTVETEWGKAIVKVVPEQNHTAPEYESCRKIAEENDVPLKEVYQEVRKRYEEEK
ncbi:MAG: nickel insertion protein, partial [Candidatus Thermoplasmatota archaeon]